MMSIFGSIMRDFDSDPFFSSQLETMHRMETMMDSMMAPFGGMMGMGIPRLTAGVAPRRDQNALRPYGFGRSLFPSITDVFDNMSQMTENPYCHSYSSSSVMTYTTDEMGRPQVYQATSSTRTAPGGVKETRNSVQDSRSGLQKMAIGHHLGERGHIIEKERNRYTGEASENQEYINIDEEEAETFSHEWQEKANPSFNASRSQMPMLYENQTQQQQQQQHGQPQSVASRVPKLPAIMPGPSSQQQQQQQEPEQAITKRSGSSTSRKRDTDGGPGSGSHRDSSGKQHKRRHGRSRHHDKSKQAWHRQETNM